MTEPYVLNCIRSTDTLIYVIGQDLPKIKPNSEYIKMDAFWHASRIKELKSRCSSMVILIAQGRYQEFAPTIIKECRAELIDGSNTASPKSYRPLLIFSLGLAALACGVFYFKYFMNGSALNS